ncbi:uncharacterized protein [Typha latifolia]|uniref:uncharacterized protein n=1 Tax=Typha latifolia TaxID=4733 RepID=UPI003C2D77C8
MRDDDQLSRLIYELCAILLTIFRSPHESPAPEPAQTLQRTALPERRRQARRTQVSPAGFAALLLGASLAMMLCGSVTFVIGFILMPWVIGLVVVFYFVGIVSNISGFGRAILCPNSPSSPKEISGQLFSKLPIV